MLTDNNEKIECMHNIAMGKEMKKILFDSFIKCSVKSNRHKKTLKSETLNTEIKEIFVKPLK